MGEGRPAGRVDPIAVDETCGSAGPEPAGPVGYDDVARRYRTLVEQLPLVVYVDALDEASSNIFTSPQVESLLGYTPAEWLAERDLFVRTLHPEDRERVLAAHARTHATHDPLSRRVPPDRAETGGVVWVRDEGVVVFDDDGRPLYLQGYLLDITAEREAQAQLRQMALYDALTGLANRAFFHEQFQHTVSIRKEPHQQTALLFIDLNDFKNVNDRWGHDVGDRRARATLGARIQETLRAGDSAARLGGDEFAIVIPVDRRAGGGGSRRRAPARRDPRADRARARAAVDGREHRHLCRRRDGDDAAGGRRRDVPREAPAGRRLRLLRPRARHRCRRSARGA